MDSREKVAAVLRRLKQQGHTVRTQIRGEGTMWFEVDDYMLVSWDEMHHLADGVYSLSELKELYQKRQRERDVRDEQA